MNRYSLITLAMLAGCAIEPADVQREGVRSEHELKHPHAAAAACLARNIATEGGLLAPTLRAVDADTTEISARVGVDHAPVYVQVTPNGGTSRATIWTPTRMLQHREGFAAAVTKGC